MATAKITYQGNLRTASIHLQSNNEIITDAPVDNNGKGEAFSPTDLVATSLAACMLTIMGIKSNDLNVDLTNSTASITKVMGTEPRRITEIHVAFSLTGNPSDTDKTILERAANTCPVLYSIHPDIKKEISFNWL